MNPPKVLCLTKIYHPNIDYEGHVCLNILRDKEWTPIMTIEQVVQGISFLFYEPNAEDPLNKAAAEVMGKDISLFQRKIRETFYGGFYEGFAFYPIHYSFLRIVLDNNSKDNQSNMYNHLIYWFSSSNERAYFFLLVSFM